MRKKIRGKSIKSLKQRAVEIVSIAIVCGACLLLPRISKADINEWTWMSGSNTINQAGVYGTKGTPDAGNVPGARNSSISWPGISGKLWLFGATVLIVNNF